ncbi:hypothetical protein, partial [Streptomyces sp. H27-D2]|uniref:hypothetical protein n=1 Tax=Streptomyces sp. H27-D2 TaxID=3046304 RepID=UPI002DBFD98F
MGKHVQPRVVRRGRIVGTAGAAALTVAVLGWSAAPGQPGNAADHEDAGAREAASAPLAPLSFSWPRNGAPGPRVRHDYVPPAARMAWGVVSPGLGHRLT